MKKRFLSLVLAMMMVLSGILPALTATASEIEPVAAESIEESPDEEEIIIEEEPIELPVAEEEEQEIILENPEEETFNDEESALLSAENSEGEEDETVPEEENEELFLLSETSVAPVYIDDGDGSGPAMVNTTTVDEEGGWSFDAATMTVTLSGFDGNSIYAQDAFTLVLDGTNTITMPADLGYAVKSEKTITVEKTTDSATDVLNISVPDSPTVSTIIIHNNSTMTMNGGTININTGELNTSSTIYGVFRNLYLKNDASLNYDIINKHEYGTTVGLFSDFYMQSSADCNFSIFSNYSNSFNIYLFDMTGSGDVTLNANKIEEGCRSEGLQIPNISQNFNLKDGATGSIIVQSGCLEKAAMYDYAFANYAAEVEGEEVGFIWSAKVAPPGYTSGYTTYHVVGADGQPLENFTLKYVGTQPFSVTDSPVYDHPAAQVGNTYSYSDTPAYPRYGVHGGNGIYGTELAEDSEPLPAGLSLVSGSGGYLVGSPTEPHAAGSYKIRMYSGNEEAFITINYGEIKDRDYFLTVGGSQINMNANNSGTGWSYTAETKTLFLSGYNGAPIYAEKDLNLVLEGTNTITVPAATGYGLKCDGVLTIDKNTNSVTDTLTINMTENPTTSTVFLNNGNAMTINGGTVNITTGELDTTSTVYGVFYAVTLNNDASLNYSIINKNKYGMVKGTFSTVYHNTSADCSFAINSNHSSSTNLDDIDVTGSGDITLSANKTEQGLQLPNIVYNFDLKDGATGDIVVASGCLEKFSAFTYAYQNYAAYKGVEKIDHIWSGKVLPAGADFTRYQIIGADGKYLEEFTLKYVGTQPLSITDSPAYDHPEGKVGETYDYNQISAYPRNGVRGGNGTYSFALAEGSDPLPAGLTLNAYSGYIQGKPTEAHEAGSYTLKAISGGESVEFTVNYGAITWNSPVESLTLDKEEIILDPDGGFDLTATVLPEDADSCDVNWSIAPNNWLSREDQENPAANQRKAVFKHNGSDFGKVTVTATSKIGAAVLDRCVVYIKERIPEASVDRALGYLVGLKEDRDYLINGEKYTAKAIPDSSKIGVPLLPEWDGKSLSIILMNAEENCNSDAQILKTTSVTLDKKELTVNVNNTFTLTATVLPADIENANINWVTPSRVFARYDQANPAVNQRQAKFTAYNTPGKHTITAKSVADGAYDECIVYIKELQPAPEVWTVDEQSYLVNLYEADYLIGGEEYTPEWIEIEGEEYLAIPVELGWLGREISVVRLNADDEKCNSDAGLVYIDSETPVKLEKPVELKLSHDYIVLHVDDDPVQLELYCEPESIADFVGWAFEENNVVSVEEGLITPLNPGTTYVYAELYVGGYSATAKCRVDVIGESFETEVGHGTAHLTATSVTSSVYSTNFATVDFVWDLRDNGMQLMVAYPDPEPFIERNGVSVEDAYFLDETLHDYFGLGIVDDNTLSIVPLANDEASIKAMKSSYKSKIVIVTADGEYTTPETLSIKVDKKLPSVKAASLKLNSFYLNETAKLAFTCKNGEVVFAMPDDENPKAKGVPVPEWLELSGDGLSVTVKAEHQGKKLSGKLYLLARVDGYRLPVPVTVSVSAASTAPKVKLSSSSVMVAPNGELSIGILLQLLSGNKKIPFSDLDITHATVMPPEMMSEKDKKTYAAGEFYFVDQELGIDPETGEFAILCTEDQAVAGKILLAFCVGGEESQFITLPLTVKLHTKLPTIKLSKSSVTLNGNLGPGADGAIVELKVTPADFDYMEFLEIRVFDKQKNDVSPEMTPKFPVFFEQMGNKIGVGLTQYAEPGTTYTVEFGFRFEGTKPAKLTVKTTAAGEKYMPTLTASAKGSIDTSRVSATSITLTPKFKNFNNQTPNVNYHLDFIDKNGELIEDGLFEYYPNPDGTINIFANPEAPIDPTDKYSAIVSASIGTMHGNYWVETAKPVKLTVKQGSIKLTPSTKSVNLYKNDRFSEQEVTLQISDTTINPIREIAILGEEHPFFEIERTDYDKFTVGFLGDEIDPTVKNGTLKVGVWLIGNETEKPNATVSVSVKVVAFKNL